MEKAGMDNYHIKDKRVSFRRNTDKDRVFLLSLCKLVLRLKDVDSIHAAVKGGVDSVENKEKEIING